MLGAQQKNHQEKFLEDFYERSEADAFINAPEPNMPTSVSHDEKGAKFVATTPSITYDYVVKLYLYIKHEYCANAIWLMKRPCSCVNLMSKMPTIYVISILIPYSENHCYYSEVKRQLTVFDIKVLSVFYIPYIQLYKAIVLASG